MYLTRFRASSCKLLRDFEVSFVNDDGSPRMWTVLVGENGLCKTTLLRAIAMTALGRDFANNLVDDVPAYLDKRTPDAPLRLRAEYAFSTRFHSARSYPPDAAASTAWAAPPALSSVIGSEPRRASLQGGSHYLPSDHRSPRYVYRSPEERAANEAAYRAEWDLSWAEAEETYWNGELLDEVVDHARSQGLPLWFVAGYGVGRVLATPRTNVVGPVPVRDRVRSLFDASHLPIGTGFADHFGETRARAFADTLRVALCDRMHVPKLEDIELRGAGGVSNTSRLIESHRFTMKVGTHELRLPAVWLSQGYQNVISLVADIVGHAWLEADAELALDDIEGMVLVDELDLHLHPKWQTQIVGGLKRAFPHVQFVATTHSPMVLAGCRQDEVWQLREDPDTGDVTAAPAQLAPSLLTAGEMYREFFDLERGQAADLGLRLQRYVTIASNPQRDDREDAELAALREHLVRNLIDVDYEPVVRQSSR